MRVLVIRHHDVDTAGFIAEAFEARGASLDVHLFPDDGPLPGFGGVDHIAAHVVAKLGSLRAALDSVTMLAPVLAVARSDVDRAELILDVLEVWPKRWP